MARGALLLMVVFMVLHFCYFTCFYWGFLGTFEKLQGILASKLGLNWGALSNHPYHTFSITVGSFKNPLFIGGFLVLVVPLLKSYRTMAWHTFEHRHWVRLLVLIPALMLAWELTTYDYNHYLDQGFYVDRLLLLILLVLMYVHPVFVPLFLMVALLYRSQFNYPIGGFPLYDKRMLFDVLILFTAFLWVKVKYQLNSLHFIFMLLCLVAGNYFATGVAKLLVSPHGYEWALYNELHNLPINAVERGWKVSPGLINFTKQWGTVLQVLTLLLEVGAILLLFKRRLTVLLLLGFTFMHLIIFINGSMLFWKWMAVDLLLVVVVYRLSKKGVVLFHRAHFKWSLAIIALSFVWLQPFRIGWHETRFNQFYSYEVVGESGTVYQFEKNDFNPYHQLFHYDDFGYLLNEKLLRVSGFGYTFHHVLAQQIVTVGSEGIPALAMKEGKNKWEAQKAIAFDEFIQTFFQHRNERLHPSWYTHLKAPHHIYNCMKNSKYEGQEKVILVKVYFKQTYIQHDSVVVLRNDVIREIPIQKSLSLH